MQWIIDNKEWLFSGIGVLIGGWILTYILNKRKVTEKEVINQSQNGGNNSTNVQGGNNVTVIMGEKNVKEK